MLNKDARFPIFFIFFIDNFGLGIVFPIITPFILNPDFGFFSAALSDHWKHLYIGIMLAAFPFAQFFGSPFFGDIADQVGRKKALYFTVIGTLVGFICSGASVFLKSYILLLCSRVITGFCAGNASICLAALADLSETEKERAKNFGVIALLGGISWMFAIIIGGIVSQKEYSHLFGPSVPFYLTSAFALLSILVLKLYFVETHVVKEKKRVNIFAGISHISMAFKMKKLRFIYFIYFLWFLSWVMGMEWFTPISLQLFGVSQTKVTIGLFVMGAAWSFGSCYVNNLLLRKLKVYQVTLLGLFFVSIFVILVAFGFNFYYVVSMYTIGCIFAAFVWSNSMNLMSLQAGENDQGTVMGVGMSMQALGWILGPLMGTFFANIHLRSIFWVAAVISSISFVVLYLVKKRFVQAELD